MSHRPRIVFYPKDGATRLLSLSTIKAALLEYEVRLDNQVTPEFKAQFPMETKDLLVKRNAARRTLKMLL